MVKLYSVTAVLCVALLLAGPGVRGGEPKTLTTRAILAKYADDMKGTWERYGLASQKSVRDQTMNDLNSNFTRDMRVAEPPPNTKISKAMGFYIANLESAYTTFPTEKTRNERNNFVKGSTACFKREYSQAGDYAETRTTQDCFTMLMKNLEQVRDTLSREQYRDARTEAYGAVSTLFNDLSTTATVPEKTDASDQMDKNLKEARQRFPITVKALADTNAAALSILESAARRVMDRARQRK